jgi:hypothetical protein
MNRIQALIARMQDIPGKEQRATQIQDMRVIRDKLQDAVQRAETLREQSSALATIDAAEFVGSAHQGLAKVATRANALKKRHDDGGGFDRKRADQTLTSINESLEQVSNTVKKGWKGLIEDQTKRYRPLAEAATRATLPGAVALNEAIELLDGWREDPPRSRQAADDYRANAASLPAAIANLGLEGRAGRFMVDASNGRGKARDLQDPDVLAFLQLHPAVWAMLKVGL